jgi:hypothetical protein
MSIENNDKKIHVNRELRIKDYCFNLNGMFHAGYKNDWRELDLAPCKTISKLKLSYCDPHPKAARRGPRCL